MMETILYNSNPDISLPSAVKGLDIREVNKSYRQGLHKQNMYEVESVITDGTSSSQNVDVLATETRIVAAALINASHFSATGTIKSKNDVNQLNDFATLSHKLSTLRVSIISFTKLFV